MTQSDIYTRLTTYSTAEQYEALLTAIGMLKDDRKAMLTLCHVAAIELRKGEIDG